MLDKMKGGQKQIKGVERLEWWVQAHENAVGHELAIETGVESPPPGIYIYSIMCFGRDEQRRLS